MKTLDRQKLDGVSKMRSNPALRDCRGQFTPEVKPLEFEWFSNCGEFAVIGSPALEMTPVLIPSNSTGLRISANAVLCG